MEKVKESIDLIEEAKKPKTKKKADAEPKGLADEARRTNKVLQQEGLQRREEELKQEAEDEAHYKTQLLDKIGQYRDRFKTLRMRNKVGFKSTVFELEDELHYIQSQLGSGSDSNAGCMAFIASMYAMETVTQKYYNPLNLDLTGLGATVKTNLHQFEDVIDELAIKYGMLTHMGPELRLMSLMAATVATVHAANSGDPALSGMVQKMTSAAEKAQETSQVPDKFKSL